MCVCVHKEGLNFLGFLKYYARHYAPLTQPDSTKIYRTHAASVAVTANEYLLNFQIGFHAFRAANVTEKAFPGSRQSSSDGALDLERKIAKTRGTDV